jgi:hypothetical protein
VKKDALSHLFLEIQLLYLHNVGSLSDLQLAIASSVDRWLLFALVHISCLAGFGGVHCWNNRFILIL